MSMYINYRTVNTMHTAPRGVQKSKFKNGVFGLKPSYLILTTIFEPKNFNTSTFGAQKRSMFKGTFLLDV